MKCFSITSFSITFNYDTVIVPLLSQMTNLEELQLYLMVGRYCTFIDGNRLHDQFLIYMTHLKKFPFNINTTIFQKNWNKHKLPSNEYIQNSFSAKIYQEVSSFIHIHSRSSSTECCIYSLPYDFKYYFDLNNSFPGGPFHKVRQLNMFDTYPFEYKLFQLISQSFPFLELLKIKIFYQMQEKQHQSTSIIFPYVTCLDLKGAHIDYVELFLLTKNIHLPS